ncbi:MAG: hypothetical protein IJL46_01195 [Clostridia bacterium]|nr:hypothetical protein [Clostridia bacterium]MBQ5956167.1 hypothetical protein [Clostridia bacterium]MBQ6003314.1 hypothetical protein [Clostridia bacterium]
MKRYYIENVKYGITDGGIACGPIGGNIVVTIQFKDSDKTQWISLIDVTGIPNIYLTDRDVFQDLIKEDFDDIEFTTYITNHSIDNINGIELGSEYDDIFNSIDNDPENPVVPLIKYLINLARAGEDETDFLISQGISKYADEIKAPESDVEERCLYNKNIDEFLFDIPSNTDISYIYKKRLALETDLSIKSVFHDIDGDSLEVEKNQLRVVKKLCGDERNYNTWKESFISEQFEKRKEEQFLVCSYLFAGIGQYETVIPSSELDSFISWIDGNGSAFYIDNRKATKNDIITYISLHADENLQQ